MPLMSDADIKRGLALKANLLARTSRNASSAPPISGESTAEQIASWLQWNDPNGCHTAERAAVEGFDFYTDETAWEALQNVTDDD